MNIRRVFLWTFLMIVFYEVDGQENVLPGGIEERGISLNEGWIFHPGDRAEWANPALDEIGWTAINPSQDIHHLPEIIPGEIGWFRLTIKTDLVKPGQYGLIMQSSGASEMFLDGKLVHKFGVVSSDPGAIRAFDPLLKPISLILSDQPVHVIAVRMVLQPGIHYSTMYETRNPAIQAQLLPINQAFSTYQFFLSTIVGMHLVIIGTCLLLAILHFAFFIFYPSQKGNLLVAIYASGFILFNILQYYFFLLGHDVATKFYLANISMDIRMCSTLLLVLAIYKLLEKPRDKYFWILVGLTFICLFLNVWPYDKGWKIGGAFMEILYAAAITRIAYQCTQQGKRGAWIILGGSISYFIFFGAFFTWIFLPNNSFLLNLSLPRIVLYVLAFLSIPLATSIYLGLDFAFANSSLQEKLKEVETLSEKNIQQEREKQELLAAQNETLEKRVEERTNALSLSLQQLKSTQSQLIQSEKMASLGELTAGIAHEIQNPLNFVNNFSEVNKELITEMNGCIDQQQYEEAAAIAKDILANQEKICHHGSRADGIVKGMLQHSHNQKDVKAPAAINTLTDEYLRLAYHGFRSKHKNFSATIETDYDSRIGQLNIVSPDIGRVILNLLNNAFYVVSENALVDASFKPAIWVQTKQLPALVEISVRDNGPGIPAKILDKIFQPFFTTKPTGEGTGLGLSLSYDIITKGHGGELIVQSIQGEGTTFIIRLPDIEVI